MSWNKITGGLMTSFDDELKAVKNWFASIDSNARVETGNGIFFKQFLRLTKETRRNYLLVDID